MASRLGKLGYVVLGILLILGFAHPFSHPHFRSDCVVCIAFPGGRREDNWTAPVEQLRQNRIDALTAGVFERKTRAEAKWSAKDLQIDRDACVDSPVFAWQTPCFRDRLRYSIPTRAPPLVETV